MAYLSRDADAIFRMRVLSDDEDDNITLTKENSEESDDIMNIEFPSLTQVAGPRRPKLDAFKLKPVTLFEI
jgi:hypothetical protein